MKVLLTFTYLVQAVSKFVLSFLMTCNNSNTILPLSNSLDIIKQVLMLLILLCVVYLKIT